MEVAAHGESNGVEVPCLLIAAKDDLEPDSTCAQNAQRVWSNLPMPFFCFLSMHLASLVSRLLWYYISQYLFVQVCTEMGVEPPISVSMKLGDISNLFRRIVDAAQRPHLSIPETEQGRKRKHYKRLITRSLTVAAGKLVSD